MELDTRKNEGKAELKQRSLVLEVCAVVLRWLDNFLLGVM